MMNFNDGKIMRAENRANVRLFVSATFAVHITSFKFFKAAFAEEKIFAKQFFNSKVKRDLVNLPVHPCHDDHDLISFPIVKINLSN